MVESTMFFSSEGKLREFFDDSSKKVAADYKVYKVRGDLAFPR